MPEALIYKDMFSKRWRRMAELPRKESAFHIELVQLLRWCLRPDVIFRHVPNGEQRDARTAAKLKAMGVLPGSADLEFFWAQMNNGEKQPRVLHLELKRGNARQSESQAAFALAVKLAGHDYEIARSIDEAVEILRVRGLLRADRRIG